MAGQRFSEYGRIFLSPYEDYATASQHKDGLIRNSGVHWFTNLEFYKRHEPLRLITMARNLKYSKHKIIREQGYPKYDNYDAIEVPFTDEIPDDCEGIMGVPITFLDKYCPEQFKILSCPYIFGDCGYHKPGTD